VKTRKKPIQVSPVISLLFLPLIVPLMLVGAVISIPYSKIRRRTMARREERFTESMRLSGRVMDWEDFVRELDQGNGMLIVERFSFKGPIRLWWTRDDLYKTCPYPRKASTSVQTLQSRSQAQFSIRIGIIHFGVFVNPLYSSCR
jgi:hypothetical protein